MSTYVNIYICILHIGYSLGGLGLGRGRGRYDMLSKMNCKTYGKKTEMREFPEKSKPRFDLWSTYTFDCTTNRLT